MAYKFQLGPSVLSGTLEQEGSINIVDDGSGTFELKVAGTARIDSAGNVLPNQLRMADNTSGKFLVADGTSYEEVAMSGDATLASGGAVTIGGLKIKGPMLNANVISGLTGSFTGDIDDDDEFLISHTNIGQKKVDFSVVRDAVFNDVSGDATVAAGGALTIAADAVESGMLNDNVISGQNELAHADIADADELMISDGGTLKKVGVDSLRDHYFGVVSGDATIADGGALTIAADAVESGMLNDDVISGQTELAHADIVDADELMISDGGVLKKVGVDSLRDHYFGVISGDATVADGGALTIASQAVESSMLNPNVLSASSGLELTATGLAVSASFAGAGLAFSLGGEDRSVLAVDIDGLSAGTTLHQTEDHFMYSDNGVEKKITFSDVQDSVFADVSGDATIAAGGALTIAANAVEDSMVNDNVATGLAGVGLSAASGVMALDLNELGAAAVDVANDILAFIDVNDSNASKKVSFADLATALAGPGLSASGGVISTQAGNVQIFGDENKTLLEGMNAGSATLSADRTLTLPASPSSGDVVHVKAPASLGGNELIIQKGSADHRIDGQESIEIESDGGAVSCMFIGSNTWVIF